MSIHVLAGGLPTTRVAQVSTLTVGSSTDAQTFLVNLRHPSGSSSVDINIATDTAATDTTSSIAAAIVSQFNASTHEFAAGITATQSSADVILTADKAGIPFVVNTTGSTGTFTVAATTVNRGPNDWSVPEQWFTGEVPGAADDVDIQGTYSLLYGLGQSAIALEEVVVHDYSGQIGWPGMPLRIDPDRFTFDSRGRAWIDIGSANISPVIKGTAAVQPYGLNLIGSNMATVVVESGNVAIAGIAGDTATAVTILNRGGNVFVGPGVTLTNFRQTSGSSRLECGATTLVEIAGGDYIDATTGTQTRIVVNGERARVDLLGSGTITTLDGYTGYVTSRNARATRTISTFNDHASLRDDIVTTGNQGGTVTVTARNSYGIKSSSESKGGR